MLQRLFTYPGDFRALKALIAADVQGIQVEQVDLEMGTDNKTADFLRMNPIGKVPVLQTPHGMLCYVMLSPETLTSKLPSKTWIPL